MFFCGLTANDVFLKKVLNNSLEFGTIKLGLFSLKMGQEWFWPAVLGRREHPGTFFGSGRQLIWAVLKQKGIRSER